jgi:hypothetical protein
MLSTLSRQRLPRILTGLLLPVVLATQALAQTSPPVRRPDPLDPKVAVPALRHESAIASYRRGGDEKSPTWREANDTVTRIGGWRVYAREAQQADPPASAPPAASPRSGAPAGPAAPPSHAGHGSHKKP